MEPTYLDGDRLFVCRFIYKFKEPKIGDVIVLKDPRTDRLILKRIKDIEGNKYVVYGDNPNESTDSREFGKVERDSIVGRVIRGGRSG